MKGIDTHSHLYATHFHGDMEEVVSRARSVLSHIILPNIDLESINPMLSLVDSHPDLFFPLMGLHPCHVGEDWRVVLRKMEGAFLQRTYYGVGETGLDYYWDKTFVSQQKEALQVQIGWAKEMDIPLILHCRDSMDEVIRMVREGQDGRLRGIFHCFNGTFSQAEEIWDLGFWMGIGGVVTYKNGGLAEVVKEIPMDRMVLETDSPYLPPVPHRGKRNESAYLNFVAMKIAELKECRLEEVYDATSRSAKALFKIPS